MEDRNKLSMIQSWRCLNPHLIMTLDALWDAEHTSICICCNTHGHPRQENTMRMAKRARVTRASSRNISKISSTLCDINI